MSPAEESPPEQLYCSRDATVVQAEAAECLHPSSQCDYRTVCEVVDAARRRRREDVGGGGVDGL